MKHRLTQRSRTLWYLEKCWRQVLVFFKRNRDISLKLSSQLQEVKDGLSGRVDILQSRLFTRNREIHMWIFIVEDLDFPQFSRNFQLILGSMTATDKEISRFEEAIGILQKSGSSDE